MPEKSLWEHINVALPGLPYLNDIVAKNDKSSTTNAAHSRTPCSIRKWDDFEKLIGDQALKDATVIVDADVEADLANQHLHKVSTEQQVTANTVNVLSTLSKLMTFEFTVSTAYTTCYSDIVAMEKIPYVNTGGREKLELVKPRAEVKIPDVLFCLETKPFWKYKFLLDVGDTTQKIIDLWPERKEEENFPENWSRYLSAEQRKVRTQRQFENVFAVVDRLGGLALAQERAHPHGGVEAAQARTGATYALDESTQWHEL